jgi:hypothetical protein
MGRRTELVSVAVESAFQAHCVVCRLSVVVEEQVRTHDTSLDGRCQEAQDRDRRKDVARAPHEGAHHSKALVGSPAFMTRGTRS